MTLHTLSAEVLQLMLGALVVGRMILPLEGYTRSSGTRWLSWLIMIVLSAPLLYALLGMAGGKIWPRSGPEWIVLLLGFMWALSIVPAATLSKAYRLPNPMLPPKYMKVIIGSILVVSLIEPAGFAPFYALVYAYNKDKFRFVSQTELLMPHGLSVVMVAYFVVSMFTPISDEALCIGLTSTAGAHYFGSGVKKIRMGWIWRNQLGNIAIAARMQNRWGLLSHYRFTRSLVFRSSLMAQLVVVCIEAAALGSFLDQRVVFVVFPLLIAMHLGILVSTGIFFWKWIIALVGILLVQGVVRAPPFGDLDMLSLVVLIGSAIGLPFLSSKMISLGWFDGPVSRRVSFVLRGGGSEAVLNPYDVAPLDMLLSQARQEFYFEGVISSLDCLGACYDAGAAVDLNKLSASADFTAEEKRARAIVLLRTLGMTYWDRAHAEREVELLIKQLRLNLTCPSRLRVPTYHILNRRDRTDAKTLDLILSSPGAEVWIERQVFFYCRSSDKSIMIDDQAVQVSLENDLRKA